MSIKFTCPHCQHRTTVAESFVGQSGECAVCGKAITVEPDPQDLLAPRGADRSSKSGGGAILALLLTLGGMGLLIAFVIVLVVMSIPATQLAQSTARQHACAGNLARIGQAFLDYHEDHGSFPPAYVADADGNPKHSWRVLLLPYLGEHSLYQQYNMNWAWDDPRQARQLQSMPAVYHCPADQLNNADTETNYLLVTGEGTAFVDDKTTSSDDITDGPENTILLVEAAGTNQPWLEPRDLDRRGLNLSLNTGLGPEIGSYHAAGGAHAVMADGSVRWLDNLTSTQIIEALLTIDAGDDAAQ